jgi:uncharacterized membrane protein HdeD (DUF308 family)
MRSVPSLEDQELRPAFRPGMLAFRAVVAFAFVAASLLIPLATIYALSLWVGAYLFVDGLSALFLQNAGARAYRSYGWTIFTGALGVLAGVLTFFNPMGTAYALAIFAGAWAVALGVLEIVGAAEMKRACAISAGMRAFLVVTGLATFVVGALILLRPALGLVALLVLVAVKAFLTGVSSVGLAVEVRRCLRSGICPPSLFLDESERRRSA